MAQARIGAQGPQQRVLQHVLGGLLVGHPARVGEQLVAVALDQRPERGRSGGGAHFPTTWQAPGCEAAGHVVEELAVLADPVHAGALHHPLRGDVRARGVGEHAGQAVLAARPLEQRDQRLRRVAVAARGLGEAVADPHGARVVGPAVEAGGADHGAVIAADDLVGAERPEVAAVLGGRHHEPGRDQRAVVGIAGRPRAAAAAAPVDERDRLLDVELHHAEPAGDDPVRHGLIRHYPGRERRCGTSPDACPPGPL